MFLFQIFGADKTATILLTVQSNYNSSLENTSLYFIVCDNSAGGCDNNLYSTVATTNQHIYDNNSNFIITTIFGCLAGVIAIALIVFGLLCWKQRRNLGLSNKESNLLVWVHILILTILIWRNVKNRTRLHVFTGKSFCNKPFVNSETEIQILINYV